MKLIIGDKCEFLLPDDLCVEKRLEEVNVLLQSKIEFDGTNLTIVDYLKQTWDKQTTKIFLDRLGYYLSKKPNQNGRHDKYILTHNKEKEMSKGIHKKEYRYVNFTDLPKKDKVYLGLQEDKISN